MNGIYSNYEVERLAAKVRIAKRMSDDELAYAIHDCQKCIVLGVEEGRYVDEIQVYRDEIHTRMGKKRRRAG